jgi:hypothetical protein
MRAISFIALLGMAGCSTSEECEVGFEAARERYAALVEKVEGSESRVEEVAGSNPDSQLASFDAQFTVYQSPCVLVFVGPNCGPCVTAVRDFVPRLKRRGWRVYIVDELTGAATFKTCGVDAKPTFVCVRRGVECGRSIGADWSSLCEMLRKANERRFTAAPSAGQTQTSER